MKGCPWTVVAALALVACRTPGSTSAPASSGSAPAPSGAPPAAGAPPPVAVSCSRDDDCAVARVAPSGEHACCPACATTPGTRRWHAALQRWCGAHPPSDCVPLACPQGPTRAVCREGRCEATPSALDGGPGWVPVERRCLPAVVCDAWAGCALGEGNAQDGWFVVQAERAPRGELLALDRVASGDAGAIEVFRLTPSGAPCPPHTVPTLFPPPSFACAEVDGQCKAALPSQ